MAEGTERDERPLSSHVETDHLRLRHGEENLAVREEDEERSASNYYVQWSLGRQYERKRRKRAVFQIRRFGVYYDK